MKLITWFFSFIAVLGAEAWFLQPNKPWTFEWEPLLLLIASIGIFLSIERGLFKHANPSDIELLKNTYALFENEGGLSFFKNHDFGGSFVDAQLRPLEIFVISFRENNRKFINQKIEVKKNEALLQAEKLLQLLSKHTFLLKSNSDIRKVYPEKHYDEITDIVKAINEQASLFYKTFADFIDIAQKELKVSA